MGLLEMTRQRAELARVREEMARGEEAIRQREEMARQREVWALEEMARVLKPGGWLLIADIEHHGEYVHRLNDLGFVGVRHVVSRFWDQVRRFITFGTFRPGTVIGQKVVAPSVA